MKKETYEDLEVFKETHKLVLKLYKVTKLFPQDERFRLIDQICRSAYSIPANIAEGYGRYSIKERINFLYISRGSVEELKYHILLAKDLGYINPCSYTELRTYLDKVGKMLNGLIGSLRYQNTRKPRN